MKWLKAFFRSSFPWNQESVCRRLRPLKFREATAEDFPVCERLHIDNEPFGVPSNHRSHFSEFLKNGDALTMMVEDSNGIVGTCGISWAAKSCAWLSYGLVRPDIRRSGIGTTMFITRLSLLPTNMPDHVIGLSALETSLSFYQALGFRLIGRFDSPDGNRYPLATLSPVHSRIIEECRTMLADAGTQVPNLTDKIPFAKVQAPSLMQSV